LRRFKTLWGDYSSVVPDGSVTLVKITSQDTVEPINAFPYQSKLLYLFSKHRSYHSIIRYKCFRLILATLIQSYLRGSYTKCFFSVLIILLNSPNDPNISPSILTRSSKNNCKI